MDDFIVIKCPGCARDMQLDSKTRSGSCPHCASRVNYRDARSMPAHICAEPEEKEQFAHAFRDGRSTTEAESSESDEIVPEIKPSLLNKRKAGVIASIVIYSLTLLVILVVLMSLPGITDVIYKTPVFIGVVLIFFLRIGFNVFKLIRLKKES